MKQASNSFTKGLMLDIHPSAVQNTQLTDALNATMITYNGNEMMLQNDMGNTLIQDSKTGHIMGLSEGFVPVGLKEHGGIMYVISANKEGVGEIGTIPSPILQLSLRTEQLSQKQQVVTTKNGPITTMISVTDFKVYPGEKFLPALNLQAVGNDWPTQFVIKTINKDVLEYTVDIGERLISPTKSGQGCAHTGLYEIKLFSIYDTSSTELKNVQTKQARPFLKNSNNIVNNSYWFYKGILNEQNIDIERTWLNKGFHTYPGNLPPGRLAIKAELESIDSFDLPKISQSKYSKQQGTKAPYIEKSGEEYKLYFPGFEYKTKSIRFIGELEITLTHQTSGIEKYHETLSGFTTVDVGENQYYYQIQSSKQDSYKKIVYTGKPENNIKSYFTPLFSVSIGKDLDAWYSLEVKYKDIYDGDIDTFIYAFNPYHILNYDESYGSRWEAISSNQQYYQIGSPENQWSFYSEETGIDRIYSITTKLTPESSDLAFTTDYSNPHYEVYVDDSGGRPSYEIKYSPTGSINTRDCTLRDISSQHYALKIPSLLNPEYLYLNSKFYWDPIISGNNSFDVTWSFESGFYFSNYDSAQASVQAFGQYLDGGNVDSYIYYNGEDIYSAEGNKLIKEDFSTGFSESSSLGSVSCGKEGKNLSILDNLTVGQITLYDSYPSFDSRGEYEDTTVTPFDFTVVLKPQFSSLQFKTTLQNKADYIVYPSFSLIGNSDEKLNVTLGLNKQSIAKEAWTFQSNLYQTCMPEKNIKRVSSFEKNACYYKQSDQGEDIVLDAGTYLITVDAGIYNSVGCYYSPNGEAVTKVDVYGCNLDWEDSSINYIGQNFKTNPKIAVIVNNVAYQLARADSMKAGGRRRIFMPTLLYLPKQSIIRLEWKNIEKLQGVGVFRITKSISFNNGGQFDEGDNVRVMYYQHPNLREIILPLESTYQEYALCLDEEYDYYSGMRSLSSTNHHVKMDASGIKFCKAPDRAGTWNYNDTDPTYIWDPNGEGLMEFIYQYDPNNPVISTEIPKVDSLQSNRLEYRKLNSTT